ncbi:hypothetical protein IAU59_000222 [Kwoniella sp. CBS 9459]
MSTPVGMPVSDPTTPSRISSDIIQSTNPRTLPRISLTGSTTHNAVVAFNSIRVESDLNRWLEIVHDSYDDSEGTAQAVFRPLSSDHRPSGLAARNPIESPTDMPSRNDWEDPQTSIVIKGNINRFTQATYGESAEGSCLAKHSWTGPIYASYDFPEDPYTPQSSWELVKNEDSTLRRLIDFQGELLPSYYGLYGLFRKSKKTMRDAEGNNIPDLVIMVMESLGEQERAPITRDALDFNLAEKLRIIALYEDLHVRGRTVHSPYRVNARHIRRRQNTTRNGPNHSIIIDFQKSRLIANYGKKQRWTLITIEENKLSEQLYIEYHRKIRK